MPNWRACIEPIMDVFIRGERGASILKKPKATMEEGGAVTSGIFKPTMNPLFFLRPLAKVIRGPGKIDATVEEILSADARFPVSLQQFVEDFLPVLRKIDPDHMFGKGFYDPVYEAKFKEFLHGRNPNFEREMFPVKRFLIDKYNATVGVERGEKLFDYVNDDIVKIFQTKVLDPKSPNIFAYELRSIVPSRASYKMYYADPEAITAKEFVTSAAPQLIRKELFDVPLEHLKALVPKLPLSYQRKYAMQFLSRQAGKRTTMQAYVDDVINDTRQTFGLEKIPFSVSAKYTHALQSSLFRGILGGNPGAAFLNYSQSINTAAEYGPMLTLRGLKNYYTKPGRGLLQEVDVSLFGNVHDFFRRVPGVMGAVDKAGYFLYNQAEHFNRGVGFHTGLSKYLLDKGLSLEDFVKLGAEKTGTKNRYIYDRGIRAGLDASNNTQFLYSSVHRSPYLQGPFGRLFFGQFTSFALNQAEYVWRNIQREPVMFPLKFLAFTGFASVAANYTIGSAIGMQLGGAGHIPIAWDLAHKNDGEYMPEAIWLAMNPLNFARFMPGSYQLGQGLTPAGGILFSLLKIAMHLGNNNEEQAAQEYGDAANKIMAALPFYLAVKRASEAGMAMMAEEGKVYDAGSAGAGRLKSALEQTGFIPVLDRFINHMIGAETMPVSRFTGNLKRTISSPREAIMFGSGLRTTEQELEAQMTTADRARGARIQSQRQILVDQYVQALERNDDDALERLAIQIGESGLYMDEQEFAAAVTRAYQSRILNTAERTKKQLPSVAKARDALDEAY